MFQKTLKAGVRNFWKNKSYSFLNILGLAIGIACAGLIFLWVEDETAFDGVHIKKERLYLVMNNWPFSEHFSTYENTPGLMGPAMKKEIPGIVNTCRTTEGQSTQLIVIGNKSVYSGGVYADSSLFSMFTISFIQGRAVTAFAQIHSMVITEKAARKFFGDDKNVMGRTVRLDNKQDYRITGVVKDLPENNSIQFEWLVPFDIFFKENSWLSNWDSNGILTMVELEKTAGPEAINQQLHDYIKKRVPKSIVSSFLFPMKDWHLHWDFENGKPTGKGRIQYVHMFSLIAWIILFLACINFMNLATARSEKRAKEVGVRKVLGSGRGKLIIQFISEAMFLAFLSVIVGVLLMMIALPFFNTLAQKQLALNLSDTVHLLSLLGITLVCGLVAGSYPSLYLSSFNPVFVLKGIKMKSGSAALIRRGLVVMQFSVSIILIICTIIIFQQIEHVKNRELGYDLNNQLLMDVQGNMGKQFNAIKQDLLNTGVVEKAALSDHETIYGGDNSDHYSWEGKDPNATNIISWRNVSPELLSTNGIKVVLGRDFYPDPVLDSSNIIITESLAKLMNKPNPIGAIIHADTDRYTVIGMVKDFVYGNVSGTTPDPLIFFCNPHYEYESVMYVRLKKQVNTEKAVTLIESVMKKDNPLYPFQYRFEEDQFNRMFLGEMLVSKLSRVFAVLAICISCLGLFGLAAFTAERRTKEIGIRKVLGAGVMRLAGLLSGEFLKLIAISSLLAFPVAWYAMHSWLQNYAYHITISWWVFVMAGTASILIALITISFQTIRAAVVNPIRSLRSE
jgi:putative ABC transport system permease protein